ncbi:Tudor domain-containing protein 1 [Amphibalanus amphitrite]|uniref:Tudor domain-containing protein 1 n=1 Tax=Amphibalanus amphitrite TaxID=1232801 RepID=A0A6A4V6T6_AMPAM|nr:Tudor domain-containing protein 1 [Amphibalanus amphitrite]
MAGELNMFVTSVTSSGPHIKFYAQLHTEKYAALDAVINANQNQFDMSTLSSPYELKPGEQVLVKSLSGAAAKWHRARVNNIQSIEYGTVAIQFIDYGTNEVVHHSQICTSKNPVAASILAQPPLAVECVLADVVPALALWSDAAISFAESKLLFQMVRGQLVRQDGPEGPLHVRVYTSDGAALASQLVVIGLGRPAQTGAVPPGFQTGGYGAAAHPPPSATPPQQPEFAVRVKEMTTAPAQPGSELLVTVCHYSNGPAKFAIQNHQQGATLTQLMADIQAYCRTSPPAPVPLLEPGAVCLGASASRDGQFLRGVLTQVDGGLVKVYWADFGHDETKAVGELRAMPRQFVGPWIQASRVSLAGLEGLTAAPAAAHVFRELTDGKLLTCKYRGKDQPNQVDLFDRDQSILELLLQRGAYSAAGPARGGAPTSVPVAAGAGALRYPSPAVSPAAAAAAAAPSGPPLVPGSVTEVLVVEVGAVNNLYVRLAASAVQLQQLLSQLSETLSVSGQQLPASNIRVGKLCAVLKDGSYQRAKVVSLGRRDIKVQYIDIGSSELVPLQSVLALEQRFATLPPQAFHCCLEGLESTHGSAEHVRFLQSVTGGGPLLCTVVQQTDRRVVRLTDPRRRPPLDINAAVRETVAAASQEPVQGQLIRGPPAVSVAKPPVEVGRAEQLVVMHVESPSSWFGQLAKLDADSLAAMEEAMQTRYSAGGNQPLSSAPIGTYCAAFSSVHEAVFRAKVIGRQGTQVTVFFIDYGDREETSVSNVFPLAAEFTQLPQLGKRISCYLQGAGAVSADAFRAAVLNQTVDVVLRACRPGTEVYEVALVSSSPTNRPIMEKLVPAGLREVPDSGTPPTSSRPPGVGSVSGPPQLPQQQLPVGVYKEVEVVHVVTPAEFYVQLKEQFPAVDAIQEQVAAYAGQPPPAAPPAVGQTVAALYPDDGVWYRGRVLETAAGKVTVFFVDYGDTRSVSLAEVRPLRPEHAALAGQAIRCCSSDVGRSGRTNWSEQEIESFRAAVMEVPYLARSDELRAGTAIVTLAKAELLEPVLGQPVVSAAPPVTRQTSGDYTKKPTPRADLDRNWRDRPAGAGPTSPPAASSDPFSGRMRMDQPESYSRPQRSGGGGGGSARDSWGGGGGGGAARDSWGGGGGGDARGGRERSWEGHDDRASQERSWAGHDNRGDRGAPDGASAFAADSRPSGGGGRPDRGGSNWPGSGRTRGGQDSSTGDDWSSGGGGGRPRGQDRNASGDSWSSGGGGRPIRGGGGDMGGRPGGGRQPPAPTVSIPEHSCRLTPAALRAGSEMRAAPTWVCGLQEFYLQPLDGAEPFNTLMTEMQTFYGGLRRPQDGAETHPAVGKPVAARFTDGAWYRAVVRRSAPAGLDVFFVDYGNSATVDKQLVKRLKEEYCRLPCQAYKCQFGGVKPAGGKWKVLSEQELAKYFEGEVQVTCLSAEGDLSSVEVALTSSGQRATDQLVADGLAERPAAARPVQQSGEWRRQYGIFWPFFF